MIADLPFHHISKK